MKKGILKRAAAAVCSAALLLTVSGINRFRTSEAVSEKAVISDEIGLVGNLFCIGDGKNADNAALQWATTLPADSYTLYRSTKPDGNFTPIYSGIGTSFRDNALQSGVTYYYQLKVTSEGNELFSDVKELTPCELPSGLNTYDNQKGSSLVYQTSGYKVGNTYYNYSLRKHSGKDDIYLEETTSSDGRNFGNARNAADSSEFRLESCEDRIGAYRLYP